MRDYTEDEYNEFFKQLFDREYPGLLRYASSILKSLDGSSPVSSKAEDAVQEAFACAWKERKDVLASPEPVGWLYNALYYKILKLLRAENNWTKRLLKYEQYYIHHHEDHLSIEAELEGIVPKEDFDLLRRIYIDGYSYQELTAGLNTTKEALAVRVYRIKKKIRDTLKE